MISSAVGCSDEIFQPAQAEVRVGSLTVSTPFIQNISVSRQRGNPKSTASCSLRINESEVQAAGPGDAVYILFHSQLIFTGRVRRIQATPTNICAGEMFLSIQAEDPMFQLEGRKVTRRQKREGLGQLAIISSKVDQPDRGFDDAPEAGGSSPHSLTGSDSGFEVSGETTNPRELRHIIGSGPGGTYGENHSVTKASRRLSETRGAGVGGGAGLHDHSDIPNLGPAHAVYGSK